MAEGDSSTCDGFFGDLWDPGDGSGDGGAGAADPCSIPHGVCEPFQFYRDQSLVWNKVLRSRIACGRPIPLGAVDTTDGPGTT